MQRTKSLREAVTGGAAKGQHGAGTPTSASCAAWIRWKSPRRHHDRGCLARPRKRTASTIAPCSRPSTRRGSYGTRCGPRRASVSQRARRRGGARCGRRCAGEVSEHVLHGKGVEREGGTPGLRTRSRRRRARRRPPAGSVPRANRQTMAVSRPSPSGARIGRALELLHAPEPRRLRDRNRLAG